MSGRLNATDLVGGQICQVFAVEDTAILIVEIRGRVLQVECWRDPEGNGPGHLDVSVIHGATSGNQVRLAGNGDAAG